MIRKTIDGWGLYRRTTVAEMVPWNEGFDMELVSVSTVDRENGSPKLGDMIARSPEDRSDQWLVSAAYFSMHYGALL